MCGIFFKLSRTENGIADNSQFESYQESLQKRGPDCFQSLHVRLTEDWCGFFASGVLWTQGPELTKQPLQQGNDILLWNGDIYEGLDAEEEKDASDTELVFRMLKESPLSFFSKACGPFAFVFWDESSKKLWFGRDFVGRHSLLCDLSSGDHLLLTSVANTGLQCQEVPTVGIFAVDLSTSAIRLDIHPWAHVDNDGFQNLDELILPTYRKEKIYHCLDTRKAITQTGRTPLESDLNYLQDLSAEVKSNPLDTLAALLEDEDFGVRVKDLKGLLTESVRRRVVTKPEYCKRCIVQKRPCRHPKIGILFSGGLDSSLLAVVADGIIPADEAVDLYNVAFERPNRAPVSFNVPDRETGRQSLEELKRLSPHRTWNFIEINIMQTELCHWRNEKIRELIHPRRSILDDSLGCALWFAARGEGKLNGVDYCSPARVVLLGMGADELFGGYSRHRKVFKCGGWPALDLELRSEIKDISDRNLGRDNRVVSDHGRQPRTPFLDEKVISYADSLPPWHRCCLTADLPRGVGDKLLLRLLASHLGLTNVATFPKRALQFGSRIANPKEKGHETCDRLNKTGL